MRHPYQAPLIALLLIAACAPSISDRDAEKLRVARDMIEAWNTLNWNAVFEHFAEDGVLHTMTAEPIVGREAIRERLQYIVDGLERIELRIVNIGVVNDVVMFERVDDFVFAGTHSTVPVVGVMEIADGKVTEWREYYDRTTLANALAVAAPGDRVAEQEILALVDNMSIVWNAGDMSGYFENYANDDQTALIFADRATVGLPQINDMFRNTWSTVEKMGTFETENVSVRLLGENLAVAYGNFRHQFPDERVVGAFSFVLQKIDGTGWKIIHEHTSRGRPATE
jgi:limonene-1,2-epoxide hydrolase